MVICQHFNVTAFSTIDTTGRSGKDKINLYNLNLI